MIRNRCHRATAPTRRAQPAERRYQPRYATLGASADTMARSWCDDRRRRDPGIYSSMIVVVQSTVLSRAMARMLAEEVSPASGSIAST